MTWYDFCNITFSDENFAPKAHAGGDKVVVLPAWLVTLNGSRSTDDKAIVSYQWIRDEQSLAAGVSTDSTSHKFH